MKKLVITICTLIITPIHAMTTPEKDVKMVSENVAVSPSGIQYTTPKKSPEIPLLLQDSPLLDIFLPELAAIIIEYTASFKTAIFKDTKALKEETPESSAMINQTPSKDFLITDDTLTLMEDNCVFKTDSPRDRFKAARLSPRKDYALIHTSNSGGDTIEIHDVDHKRPLQVARLKCPINTATFNTDSEQVIATTPTQYMILDPKNNWNPIYYNFSNFTAQSTQFKKDHILFVGDRDIRVFKINSFNKSLDTKLSLSFKAKPTAMFNQSGTYILVYNGNVAEIWTTSGHCLTKVYCEDDITSATIEPSKNQAKNDVVMIKTAQNKTLSLPVVNHTNINHILLAARLEHTAKDALSEQEKQVYNECSAYFDKANEKQPKPTHTYTQQAWLFFASFF